MASDLSNSLTRLSIETAALANGTNLIKFVGYIIQKSQEVCRFKDECQKLVNSCIALSVSFTENYSSLEHVKSGQEFFRCLQETLNLVNQCSKRWSIRHIGWEVFVAGKLESLQKDLARCQKDFNTEVLMNVSSDVRSSASATTKNLSNMRKQLDSIQVSIEHNTDSRQEFLSSVRSLGQELESSRQEMRLLRRSDHSQYESIPLHDKRLDLGSITSQSIIPDHAMFDGHNVALKKIFGEEGRSSRLLKIYRKIGDISMVQRLFGVVEDQHGNIYALMEDLSGYTDIIAFIEGNTNAVLTLMQKLQFAYDLASTLSCLHENNIIVKTISDHTIHIKRSGTDGYQPVLSELEESREIFEPSAHKTYDVRYEAPEFKSANIHSKMSDIWSLGLVLIQWFTGISPPRPSSAESHSASPGTAPVEPSSAEKLSLDDSSPLYMFILSECVSQNPFVRPSASTVAQRFLEIIMTEASKDALEPVKPKAVFLDDIEDILHVVRRGIVERKEARKALKKTQQKAEPVIWIKRFEYDKLCELLADERPVIMYLVGAILLWGVVKPDEITMSTAKTAGLPEMVLQTKEALHYLQRAHDLGFEDATEDLYYAHRNLAEYYQKLASKK